MRYIEAATAAVAVMLHAYVFLRQAQSKQQYIWLIVNAGMSSTAPVAVVLRVGMIPRQAQGKQQYN